MNIVDSIINFVNKKIDEVFNQEHIQTPPKWRLVPDTNGYYILEKWNSLCNTYICEKVNIKNEEHAQHVIAELERPTTYFK